MVGLCQLSPLHRSCPAARVRVAATKARETVAATMSYLGSEGNLTDYEGRGKARHSPGTDTETVPP